MTQGLPPGPSSRLPSPLFAIAGSVLFVAVLLAVLIYLDVHEQVVALLEWFRGQGVWAPVLFMLVSEELTPNGWKIVLLIRLIPFFPTKLANYFFGLTPIRLPGYMAGSFIGFIPFSLHNVYLGSIVADLSQLGTQELDRSPLEWGGYGVGFVATVVAILYLNRLARRALAPYTEHSGTDDIAATRGGTP